MLNVKDFGAKGDGIADDTTAIQAAIDALPNDGGVVFFPSGIYNITST
ncbi:MAG: glycosyl hydrolase family 28-related protein, partial [bacterium]